jgi:hypothetical protein
LKIKSSKISRIVSKQWENVKRYLNRSKTASSRSKTNKRMSSRMRLLRLRRNVMINSKNHSRILTPKSLQRQI